MQDRLLIITKIKKTIEYVEKIISNYPHNENNLKNKIINELYDLLELVYKANIEKNIIHMKNICVKIKMIDYLLKRSSDKKLISLKKYEIIGNYLLEINKMVNVWIKNEKNK